MGAAAVLASVSSLTAAEAKLDLPAAINMALARNRELVRSAKLLRGNALDVKSAELGFSTHIDPSGSAGVTEDGGVQRYGLSAARDFIWGTKVSAAGAVSTTDGPDGADLHRDSVSVEISQPLFRNFGPLIHGEGIVQAGSAFKQAQRAYEQQKANLVVQVVETFLQIIRLRRQISSDEEVLQRTDKLHRLTQAREAQGHATRVDALRVDLQLGEARLRLANSRENLAMTERLLAELLGAPPDQSFELEPPPLLGLQVPSVPEAVKVAFSNRLDYAQVLQDCRDRGRGVDIARRGLYPDLALKTRYERFGEGASASDASRLDQDSWFVGLEASTDLNRGQERIVLEKAVTASESAREVVKIKELSMAREIKEQLDAYRRTQTDIVIAERNLKLAENRRKLARRLFEAGRGDNFSVTDAEDSYVQAQVRLLAARSDAALSGYRLLHVLGTLTEIPESLRPDRAGIGL
jgi:outer membrane protein TolC